MKIKYEFVTGEVVEIDVDEEIGRTIIELERQEYNNNHSETRRHFSLDSMEFEGAIFTDHTDVLSDLELEEKINEIHTAIAKLNPERQDLLQAIFFDDVMVSEYANKKGVDHSAISHRLKTVYKKLKKYL